MLKRTLVPLCVMSALLIIHIQASPVEDVQQRDHPDKEKALCCCCCGYCLHCNYATGIELEKADHQTPAFVNATLAEGETEGLCCCCCGYCLHCNKDGAPKLVPKA